MTDTESSVWQALQQTAELPLPGHGDTAKRWWRLAELTHTDVVLGRLVEAHQDAVAILTELGQPAPEPGQWWGVWAAEPPRPVVEASADASASARGPGGPARTPLSEGVEPILGPGDTVRLTGAKPWCSGAGMCTHALMTVRDSTTGAPLLVAVALDHPGVSVETAQWQAAGMSRSATETVRFDDVPALLIGGTEAYLDRAGFWHGAIGVAACWFGGAELVADALRTSTRSDPHALAHLGAVDAALAGVRWVLAQAAAEVDSDPGNLAAAQLRARRVRAIVERACAEVLDRVGRALGPGPMSHDAAHAAAVGDLTIYLRQSHAEQDLAALGELLR